MSNKGPYSACSKAPTEGICITCVIVCGLLTFFHWLHLILLSLSPVGFGGIVRVLQMRKQKLREVLWLTLRSLGREESKDKLAREVSVEDGWASRPGQVALARWRTKSPEPSVPESITFCFLNRNMSGAQGSLEGKVSFVRVVYCHANTSYE